MFGENLKKYRTAKGLSQSDVAEQLFVTRQCVSKWESNVTQPDLQTLGRLSELLGVTVDELIKDSPDTKPKPNYNLCLFIANVLIATFCTLAFTALWRFMPNVIPAHWTNGVIDRYGSRNEIFLFYLMPAIFAALATLIYFVFKRHVDDKVGIFIGHCVILLMQLVFTVFFIVWYSEYLINAFSFATSTTAAALMCVGISMHPKICKPNRVIGIRTSETLKSPVIWNKVNAFGCYSFTACSVAIFTVNMCVIFDYSYLCLLAYAVLSVVVIVYAKAMRK